ncbi:hypothetical protein QZH56_35650 [Streptomyces olivoreticuli]|uniref:hypothetical protein n=1 Tax=Streptomyces olivoreticuli TaxID=68246 RepID=UPI002658BD79|nr:hypothetical protein [Streptomyces olivoreticuli]WKK23959.1 hypothetical protein QZH56_35650 [Streptomyces olivoreticuli]
MRISASKVELYAAIRRDHRAGLSGRALERKYGVTWRTVRKALDSHWPEPRKKQASRPSRLDRFKPVIDGMLAADLDAPPKQKHTVGAFPVTVDTGCYAAGASVVDRCS